MPRRSRIDPPRKSFVTLRHHIDDLVYEARRNEQKLRRFQAFELRLIGLNTLSDLMQMLLYPDRTAFQWDSVTLLLVDPEFAVRRILEEENFSFKSNPTLIFAKSWGDLEMLYPYSMFPMLGPYRSVHHERVFQSITPKPKSVALLPLVRYGRLIGSLNIGSLDRQKFVKGVLTDFFEHFAAIVAICLENATNTHRLKWQGLTDTLTSVNNRRFFDQRLREEVEAALRSSRPLTCMLLDIDHFKKVNDTFGHQVGDQVLREVAAIIRANLRGNDVLARYGGEEFSALLAQTTRSTAIEVAERIRRNVAGHLFELADGEQFTVTISIGVAIYYPDQAAMTKVKRSPEELVGAADKALYEAKEIGRNVVVCAQ